MWKRRQFLRGTFFSFAAACACGGGDRNASAQEERDFPPPTVRLSDADKERHSIFLAALCALVCQRWSIDRVRREVRAAYASAFPGIDFCEYGGHNIGALVVNGRNEVVSFALNQNRRLTIRSLTRAVYRAIDVVNSNQYRGGDARSNYDDMLLGFKVYTTLESCTLCSGVMDLANIGQVVYAQEDPGQHGIGNLLHQLNSRQGAHGAPLPVRADLFDGYQTLRRAREEFSKKDGPRGATAFLQSVEAYEAFRSIAAGFEQLVAAHHPENGWILEHLRKQVSLRRQPVVPKTLEGLSATTR
jgi:tRNA(Arg) A34 adenosine deaminase TadA